jgi:hypothetical protein
MTRDSDLPSFLTLGQQASQFTALNAQQALEHVAITAGVGVSPLSSMSSWTRDAIAKGQGLLFLSNIMDNNRLVAQDILGCAKHSGRENDISIIYLSNAQHMSETERDLVADDIVHAVSQRKIVLLPTCQWDRVENASLEGEAVMNILFRVQERMPTQKEPLLTILDEYQRLHFYPWAHIKFSKKATDLGMACIFFMRQGLQPHQMFCESVLENSGTKVLGPNENSHFNALGALWISQGQKNSTLQHMSVRELDNYLNRQTYGQGVLMRKDQEACPIQLFELDSKTELRASFDEIERHLGNAQKERMGLPARAQKHELDAATTTPTKARAARRI